MPTPRHKTPAYCDEPGRHGASDVIWCNDHRYCPFRVNSLDFLNNLDVMGHFEHTYDLTSLHFISYLYIYYKFVISQNRSTIILYFWL